MSEDRGSVDDSNCMTGENGGALVVFSYASPFADTLRMESRMVTSFNRTIDIKQRWRDGGRGGTDIGFGASVYDSSIVLSWYIEQHAADVSFPLSSC